MEAMTGFPSARAFSHSRRITSEAKALPPPESTRRTIALTLSSFRAWRIRAAVEQLTPQTGCRWRIRGDVGVSLTVAASRASFLAPGGVVARMAS